MATTPGCAVKYESGSGEIIVDAYNQWKDYVQEARDDTRVYTGQIAAGWADWVLTPIDTGFDYDPEGISASFVTPPVPEWYSTVPIDRAPLPGDVSFNTPKPINVEAPPDWWGTIPQITTPPAPDDFTEDAPVKNYTLVEAFPPDYVDPDQPLLGQLYDITLPPVPTLPEREFLAELPSYAGLEPPQSDFAWSEDPYSSALLTKVTNQISTMLDGGTGLPGWVWDMIWDRARRNEDKTALRAVEEATENWAARGFSIPSGALNMTIRRAQEMAQDNANTLNREMVIKQAELEVENLRFAVQQGLALESMMIQELDARMNRALDAEKFILDASIQIYNAHVAFYNAQLAAYQAEAAVFQTQIQADLSRVEIYKAQLDGQKLTNEVNALTVQIYSEGIKQYLSHIEAYKARVDATNSILEGNKLRIEGYKTEVEAYGEKVKAHSARYDGYAAQVQAELAKVQVYSAEAGVFKTLVDAYSANVQAETVRIQSDVAIEELNLKSFQANMSAFTSTVQAEAARLQSEADANNALSARYGAQVQAATAASAAILKEGELNYQSAAEKARLSLQQAEIDINQIQRSAALELERLKFLADVESQITASALAALNLSAQLSESVSHNLSCSAD